MLSIILGCLAAALLCSIGWALMQHKPRAVPRHRRHRPSVGAVHSSSVRILVSEAEVRAATERALAHELELARDVARRASRYEHALKNTAPAPSIDSRRPADATPAPQRRPVRVVRDPKNPTSVTLVHPVNGTSEVA